MLMLMMLIIVLSTVDHHLQSDPESITFLLHPNETIQALIYDVVDRPF